MNKRIRFITTAALIAALYVILNEISACFGLDKGAIQLRLSESLCVLPAITPAAIPGLYIGCMLASLLSGALPTDIIIGGLATLTGAVFTRLISRKRHLLASIPPIISNTAVIPFLLKYTYGLGGGIPFFALTVFIGEFICCGIFGTVILRSMPKSIKEYLN